MVAKRAPFTRRFANGLAGDLLIAAAIAGVMTLGWCVRNWPMLSALHLPDTDDVMRLQQIRDWLGGQSFADLTQHRLGAAPGLPMHWSRLADLAPGAMIGLLSPLVGRNGAELTAVIAWPAMLFAAALFIVAGIARRIDPAGQPRTAIVIAALAYPATTIFLPGRIDHHGLQVVLLLVALRGLIATPGVTSGGVVAIAACLSLVIGLETAPLLLVVALCLWLRWCLAMPGSDRALLGYAVSLGVSLCLAAWVFGGAGWLYPACDGFTSQSWQLAESGAVAAAGLALSGAIAPRPSTRLAISVVVGATLVIGRASAIGACVAPYSSVDPLLAQLWLGNVGEAQPLFSTTFAVGAGYAGLMVIGIAASAWRVLATRSSGWAMLLAVQVAALALTCLQLRGAYAGAMLAAPGLAMVVGAARARGAGWLAAAWVGSAGMIYPIAAQAIAPAPADALGNAPGGAACNTPKVLDRLAALPPGTLIAPMDVGPYAIAATRHRLIAAPYHRNNAGNIAMYRFFLGTPARAQAIARRWGATYVLYCADGFAGVDPAIAGDRRRLIGQLAHGQHPAWLRPIGGVNGDPAIFTVDARGRQSPALRHDIVAFSPTPAR